MTRTSTVCQSLPKPALFLPALLLVAFVSLSQTASAQPVPTVSNVAPVYLKHGESLDLTITGGNLADVSSVAVPNPRGLAVELVKPEKPDAAKAQLKLTAAADAPRRHRAAAGDGRAVSCHQGQGAG
jgi:hypothetical protein